MRKIACWFPIASLVLWYGVSPATIINVSTDYSTIQTAIDNSSIGDTVRVEPGTYMENIDFGGKNIVVGSWFLDAGDTSYISSTIIGAPGLTGTRVSFTNGENNSAVITGFTLKYGYGAQGGGILCYNNSDPTISHNIIRENSGQYGGGISCMYSSDPIIISNSIISNSANSGGGIYCMTSSPTINDNTIGGNSANSGGGVYCNDSYPTINNNTISGNSVSSHGGAIFYTFCPDTFGIIGYNTISGNTAGINGGGFYGSTSNVTISNNTLSENSASSNGGGIYLADFSNPTIMNTIFWGDSASSGPEIYLDNSSPVIAYCDIQDTLWTGTGNISCDPMFCEPDSGNFYLADSSCCIGVGQGGADIGALGIGCGSPTIPTLSEWGLLIMALLLLAAGTAAVVRRRKTVTI